MQDRWSHRFPKHNVRQGSPCMGSFHGLRVQFMLWACLCRDLQDHRMALQMFHTHPQAAVLNRHFLSPTHPDPLPSICITLSQPLTWSPSLRFQFVVKLIEWMKNAHAVFFSLFPSHACNYILSQKMAPLDWCAVQINPLDIILSSTLLNTLIIHFLILDFFCGISTYIYLQNPIVS